MTREVVQTDNAPKAIGPYQQAIKANGFIYTAGQIPIDPKTGNFVEGGITAQTRQVLENLKAVLEAGGSSLDRVVKGEAQIGKRAGIGRWRVQKIGVLTISNHIARARNISSDARTAARLRRLARCLSIGDC